MPTEETLFPCPFCGTVNALACQLDTKPKSYAVICHECAAQGPTTPEGFEGAVEEWSQRDVEAFAASSDEALEDAVMARPDVMRRVVAGALLALAVTQLVDAGVSSEDVAAMIRAGLKSLDTEPDDDDDEEPS